MSEDVVRWSVGNVEISRIVEIAGLEFPSEFVAGGVTAAQVHELDWMKPHFCNEAGQLRLSFHAFLVRTADKIILIDTCLGAGRDLHTPLFNNLGHQFLDNLTTMGVQPADVDIVMCTHMHYDHVGWNTRDENGRWVPTFPNARYLYSAKDYKIAKAKAEADDPHFFYFADTIEPPVTAGLVDFIDDVGGYQLCDEVSLISTPGHSPDHFSVCISSRGQDAVITGDVMHNPVQCAYPDNQPEMDEDKVLAVETRRKFLERFADRPVIVLGTHFPAPTAGNVQKSGEVWRLGPLADGKAR